MRSIDSVCVLTCKDYARDVESCIYSSVGTVGSLPACISGVSEGFCYFVWIWCEVSILDTGVRKIFWPIWVDNLWSDAKLLYFKGNDVSAIRWGGLFIRKLQALYDYADSVRYPGHKVQKSGSEVRSLSVFELVGPCEDYLPRLYQSRQWLWSTSSFFYEPIFSYVRTSLYEISAQSNMQCCVGVCLSVYIIHMSPSRYVWGLICEGVWFESASVRWGHQPLVTTSRLVTE